jgi:glyoxylase-like metal-dependent hydrolase (beta-lactamase superfamily II)
VASGLDNGTTRIGAKAIGVLLVVLVLSLATGRAQQNSAKVEVLPVRPNFYMITGAGGNIGLQVGPDGLVVVNTGTREAAGEVLAAIQKITKEPIRYIINTSADADMVSGNAALSKTADDVMAHENVLDRMSAPVGQKAPFPTDQWPTETFDGRRRYLYLNDEGIEILHQPAAHTDGDSVVFFRRSDVVVAGHVLDANRFPVIDVAQGGSVQGEIDALNNLIDLAIPPGPYVGAPKEGTLLELPGGTEILPGRGRVYRQLDVVNYRDMIVIIRDTIQYMIDQKMTLEQIKAAAPAKAWEPQFGSTTGPWTTNQFVEAIYKSLVNDTSKSRER